MKTIKPLVKLALYCMVLYFCTSCKEDDDGNVNQPPTIENQSFSIQENSAKDAVVGTVKATDPNSDALTFSITAGNTGDAFSINAATGELIVNTASVFDFETNPTFTLTIQVSDGTETAQATITVNVTDENENSAPVIDNQEFTIDENSADATAVGTILASDPDQNTLTFSITAGNTNDAFAIDANSGELTVNTSSELNYEVTPSFSLTIAVNDGQVSSTAVVTVSLNDIEPEPLTSPAEILQSLALRYEELTAYLEFASIFDGVYANTTTAPSTDWDNVHAHTQNSLDSKVNELWSGAFDIIFGLNNIISSAETVFSSAPEKDDVTPQALAMRAYLNFNLVMWFGSIPQETGIEDSQGAQVAQQNMIALIQSDLNTAITDLPTSWTAENEGNVTQGFARALLARTYLFSEDWSNALSQADILIGDPMYELSDNTTNFTSDNVELIWGFDKSADAEFSDFFSKGAHVPVFRLTEAYLINAHANTVMGSLGTAKDTLDELKLRAGEAALPGGMSQGELLEAAFAQSQAEMEKEGISFLTLRVFGKATTQLSITDMQLILPIPQTAIDNNPNLFQNPGY
ncbi:cadherin domain-containing protein [Fulvivirgaceae bacterium BMA12]|uniref:Cadherin domain-containing protein n=1 Tax=Agaribacillus aureus TaxID=3051825 RepID=A0ABT8L9H5_9BACT|nr:cadherin domain-containing protein [Fulvivirgaceae bacterium BMA12]